MTFEEIHFLRKNNFKGYCQLPLEVHKLVDEAKMLIDKADRKMNPKKYEELSRKLQESLDEYEEMRSHLANSTDISNPEDEVMRALENGCGEYYGY
jgi:hypothetical protein